MVNLSTKDLILIVLMKSENHSSLKGITRLQKLLFLISQANSFEYLDDKLAFEALHYGPYSDTIGNELDILTENDFVKTNKIAFEIQKDNRGDEIVIEDKLEVKEYVETKEYILSERGQQIAEHLIRQLSNEENDQINKIINEYGGLDLKELLKYVYRVAPEELLRKSSIRHELGI